MVSAFSKILKDKFLLLATTAPTAIVKTRNTTIIKLRGSMKPKLNEEKHLLGIIYYDKAVKICNGTN
jgi:hypothetical protein